MKGSVQKTRAVQCLSCAALALLLFVSFFTRALPPASAGQEARKALQPAAVPQPAPPPLLHPPPLPPLAEGKGDKERQPPSSFTRLVIAYAHTAPDAIGYSGTPPSSPLLCIHPPPFGEQCTMMADASLRACLDLAGCTALTCPDAAPYSAPHARLPRTGAVCQARSVRSAAAWRQGVDLEAGHGMCAPTGCTSFFFARLAPQDLPAPLAQALRAALQARGLQHHATLLAWGSQVTSAQRQLLAAEALPALAVLPASGSGGGWLVDPAAAAAGLLHEQLDTALPWASLNGTAALPVYLFGPVGGGLA